MENDSIRKPYRVFFDNVILYEEHTQRSFSRTVVMPGPFRQDFFLTGNPTSALNKSPSI